MKNLFAEKSRKALKLFLQKPTLLAFDYDGTLAPLGSDPSRAKMRPSTQKIFKEVSRVYSCVVISGRSFESVKPFLSGVNIRKIVGNHGADMAPLTQRKRFRRQVDQWEKQLKRELHGLVGLQVENKGFSLSIHYRKTQKKTYVLNQIYRTTVKLESCRVVPGIQVVNLIPLGAPNKASVLRKLLSKFGFQNSIFIGDDVTDEEVFGSEPQSKLFSIRVGRDPCSRATYYLGLQKDIDQFLKLLLESKQF